MTNSTPVTKTMDAVSTSPPQPGIVFFDGTCGLCDHTVNFLLACDTAHRLVFAPLQGETALALLNESERDLKSLVFRFGGRNWRKSAAAVRILWGIGGIWSCIGTLLWLVPLPLRDLGYRFIARYRYQIFGKRDTCRLPTPQERARFLP